MSLAAIASGDKAYNDITKGGQTMAGLTVDRRERRDLADIALGASGNRRGVGMTGRSLY